MIENRPLLTLFSHAVLIFGVLAVGFPLYVTFVASTLSLEQIMSVPMPLLPGDQFLENYSQVLKAGSTKGSAAPVATMLANSLVMALVIALGKIAISIIASFAIVYFRFPLLPAILPHRARRAGRGRAHRRRGADALLPRRAAAAIQD